jgi:hypothetical protein
MDNKNSVVKKPKRTPPQQPLETRDAKTGPEIWDGNNAGWTLVSYKRKKKNKK